MKRGPIKITDCENPELSSDDIGYIISMDIVRDLYEMAKLDVEKTVQSYDAIISKASYLIGLLVTVLMASCSAAYALIRAEEPDVATVIFLGIIAASAMVSLFILIFRVISGKQIYTTGETADTYMKNNILEWYNGIPRESKDKAFFVFKSRQLKRRSDDNAKLVRNVARYYNLSIRLFICTAAVVGIVFILFQLYPFF